MSGRVCSSILIRAACCTQTISCSPQTQFGHLFILRSAHQRTSLLSHSSSWCCVNSVRQLCTSDKSRSSYHAQRCFSTHEDFDYRFSQVQINSLLRASEQVVNIQDFDTRGFSAVRKFESNQLAANTPIEDRRSAATCLQTRGLLFGVFDGHGGWACAQAVSERLLYYAAVAMMPRTILEELERCMEHDKPVPPILQWHKHHLDFNYRDSATLYINNLRLFWQDLLDSEDHEGGMSPPEALHCAFKRLDNDISLEAQAPLSNDLMKNTAIQVAFAGSTACVVHVGTEGIHVANTGDCRAVLGVQEEDGSWSAVPLSSDHNCQNKSELERIHAQHPPSERDTVVVDDRLLGILMPLRAFGDVRFKWNQDLQQSVLASLNSGMDQDNLSLYQYTVPNYLTPPYLSVTPELTYHKLRPQDSFLILASDGLWDELNNEEAVQLVGEHLSGVHHQDPVSASEKQLKLGQMQELLQKRRDKASPALDTNAATHLIRHALGRGEYGELCQERLASMLALPEDLARMYRDDITALVVYLNGNLARPHHN